jgi:membrane peptidoglycan carboxypeptidase
MPPPPERHRSLLTTVLVGGAAFGIAMAALVPGMATILGANRYRSLDVGSLRQLAQRSTVYDTSGDTIAVLGTQNREDAKLAEVPKILQDAVIAVEDKTFWENTGVDVHGLLRAALKNFTSGQVQGGSTITQQLVKNRILSPKRDLNRKIKEIVLALRLNEKYSKREILEQYLNTVYFGQGSYGVKSAVERFFITTNPNSSIPRGKHLDEITIGEAALLAGLISNPEGDNPFVYAARANARRAFALARMVDEGYITQEQATAANQEPLPAVKPEAELRPKSSWAEEVQDRLFHDPMFSVLGATVQERRNKVLTGGLKIYATRDPKIQQAAQDAIDQILPEKPGFTGALLAMDPRNGEVKAMVAGPGFEQSQYNIATSYPGRQAGSTWKVITLAAALEKGFSPEDQVDGTSPCDFGGTIGKTQNAEGGGGTMTLRAATAHSVNCAFARTELAVGFDSIIATAHKMGITQQTLQPILTLTLGTIESTPLEMATVTSTIANGGMHHDPVFVSKIVGPDGTVVFDDQSLQGEQAISADTAACEIDMLKGVITGGTGTAARLANHVAFGKTGTTDGKADANFLGATPQLAAFIWHGNATARVPGAGFGGQVPARIFKAFMDAALVGEPKMSFPPPGPYCDRSGQFITPVGRAEKAPAVADTAVTDSTVATVPPQQPPVTAGTTPATRRPEPPATTSPPTTSPPTTSPPPTSSGG